MVVKKNKGITYLPQELITEILSRLSVKALLRFKCVSKAWFDLISDPNFVKIHLNQSLKANSDDTLLFIIGGSSLHSLSIDALHQRATHLSCLPSIKFNRVMGSCHGLVCFTLRPSYEFVLYNPTTRAYKQLPLLKSKVHRYSSKWCDDFGYDCISDDYKVFRYLNNEDISEGTTTQFYSLKANVWEIIQNPPSNLRASYYRRSIVVNNSFHWLSYNDTHKCMKVIYFHLLTREYGEMEIPITIYDLALMRGHLHAVSDTEVWVMKEYGITESWTLLFCHSPNSMDMDIGPFWRLPLTYARDGRILIKGVHVDLSHLVYYDLDDQVITKVQFSSLHSNGPDPLVEACSWIESLVTL